MRIKQKGEITEHKGYFVRIHSRNFLPVICFSLVLISCTAQPRFCPEPVPRKGKDVEKIETQNTRQVQSESSEKRSSVDQGKMEGIIDSYMGSPYKRGGETKAGMDCSGLVVAVYRQYSGFVLPHDTKKLFKLVKRIDKKNLAYGDLVFFSDGWFGVSHVGIYIGEGKFVHSIEDFGVIASSLEEDYYQKRYLGARRVIP
jgi:lipoprotein Spr